MTISFSPRFGSATIDPQAAVMVLRLRDTYDHAPPVVAAVAGPAARRALVLYAHRQVCTADDCELDTMIHYPAVAKWTEHTLTQFGGDPDIASLVLFGGSPVAALADSPDWETVYRQLVLLFSAVLEAYDQAPTGERGPFIETVAELDPGFVRDPWPYGAKGHG